MERNKLRGRIVEKYGSLRKFASVIETTPGTVSNVVTGKTTPPGKKMPKWCEALDIDTNEIGLFFYPRSLENSTEG